MRRCWISALLLALHRYTSYVTKRSLAAADRPRHLARSLLSGGGGGDRRGPAEGDRYQLLMLLLLLIKG